MQNTQSALSTSNRKNKIKCTNRLLGCSRPRRKTEKKYQMIRYGYAFPSPNVYLMWSTSYSIRTCSPPKQKKPSTRRNAKKRGQKYCCTQAVRPSSPQDERAKHLTPLHYQHCRNAEPFPADHKSKSPLDHTQPIILRLELQSRELSHGRPQHLHVGRHPLPAIRSRSAPACLRPLLARNSRA